MTGPIKDRYDIVIVGAGPLGLASAYHLAEREPGRSLLVVDARSGAGEGSMGASNSMVRDVFSSEDNRRLAGSSIGYYRHLMAENEELRGPVPLLDLYGYLWLVSERERVEYGRLLEHAGDSVDARLLDLDALGDFPGLARSPARWYDGDRSEPPPPIAGALFGRRCGALAPELFVRHYVRETRRLGAEFAFGRCVQRLSFEGREEVLLHDESRMPFAFQDRVPGRLRVSRVHFGDGLTVRADRVVVAAGAWAERLLHPLGFATGCSARPQGSYSVAGPGVDALLGWAPRLDPIAPEGDRARLPFVIVPTGGTMKPVFRERRLWLGLADTVSRPIGTLEDPAQDGRLDFDMSRMVSRDSFATDVLPAFTPYLPRFDTGDVRLDRSWGGYYHFSPDGLPVVEGERHGILFVGGDSGSGIMKADALGRIVAARLEGASHARLFSGESYAIDRLSLEHRDVEEERLVL